MAVRLSETQHLGNGFSYPILYAAKETAHKQRAIFHIHLFLPSFIIIINQNDGDCELP